MAAGIASRYKTGLRGSTHANRYEPLTYYVPSLLCLQFERQVAGGVCVVLRRGQLYTKHTVQNGYMYMRTCTARLGHGWVLGFPSSFFLLCPTLSTWPPNWSKTLAPNPESE